MVAALATMTLTVFVTWLVHGFVAAVAPAGAQPVIWLGLASAALELVLALWCIRLFTTLEADRAHAQMQFFAAAVHDVRQPLQAAGLFIDNLLHPTQGAQHQKVAKSLDLSLQAIRHTLDGFMDSAALDAGAVEVRVRSFSLLALLHALETEFTPRAIAADLRFCLFCPATDVLVQGDPQLVSQIIRNVLVHVIARTGRGGVLLGVRHGAGQVRLQVWGTHARAAEPDKKPDRGLVVAARLADLTQLPLSVAASSGGMWVSTLTLPRAAAKE